MEVHTEALTRELEAVRTDARDLAGDLSAAQLGWKPAPESWSIAQCFDHLARTARLYAAVLRQALEKVRAAGRPEVPGPFELGPFERYFIRSLEPPPKRRFKAPRSFEPAAAAADEDAGAQALADLEAAYGDLKTLLEESRGLDLGRVRIFSPATKLLRFRAAAAFQINAAHGRRHIWQARRVLEAAGFPQR